jgi:predicted Zn-dependent protease
MLGFSQFNQGHFDAAAEAFGSARSASMADDRAAYSWAFSLARTGKAQDANSIANELVARSLPTEILSLVCHLYVDSENYNGSLDCYRKVYAQDPGLLLAHFEAGQALVHLDRPQEAVAELQEEKKLQPDNPDVEYALDYALLQSSKKDEAQQRLAALVSKHPEHAAAQYQLGKLLLDEGNVAEAVEHLEASERADDSADYVHYQLGAAYRKANRSEDAEREFKVYREMKDKKRASATLPPAAANQQP